MKKFFCLAVLCIILALGLWKFGASAVQAAREVLPVSWTKQGEPTRTLSPRSYGLDHLTRKAFFDTETRRNILYSIVAGYALVSLFLLSRLLGAHQLSLDPRWTWWDLIWVIVGVIVFIESIPVESPEVPRGILFVKELVICVWIVIVARYREIGAAELGLSLHRIVPDAARGIGAAFLYLPVLMPLILILLIQAGPGALVYELTIPVPTSAANLWLSVLVLPFFEEILFRGFLYRFLRARWPEILANLSTSFLFAAGHETAGPVQLGQFLGSLLMCRLYESTGTLWSGLAAHAAFNALILVGPFLF